MAKKSEDSLRGRLVALKVGKSDGLFRKFPQDTTKAATMIAAENNMRSTAQQAIARAVQDTGFTYEANLGTYRTNAQNGYATIMSLCITRVA